MTTIVSRVNITLPKKLLEDLRLAVPKRARSKLIAEMLEEKLTEVRREKALEKLKGVWDKAGGVKFSTEDELSAWRKKLWATFEKRIIKK